MPVGNFRLTIFDQWNDLLLDGLVHPLNIDGSATVKEFPVTQCGQSVHAHVHRHQWRRRLAGQRAWSAAGFDQHPYRDGSFAFFNNTDLNGFAGFNEVFPFMNWLVSKRTHALQADRCALRL